MAYIVSKASRRIFVIQQLLKAGTAIIDILTVYCSIVRSVLEYACQVWHSGLTLQQSNEIESVQRRVMRLILPDVSYKESLKILGIEKLTVRLNVRVMNYIIYYQEELYLSVMIHITCAKSTRSLFRSAGPTGH